MLHFILQYSLWIFVFNFFTLVHCIPINWHNNHHHHHPEASFVFLLKITLHGRNIIRSKSLHSEPRIHRTSMNFAVKKPYNTTMKNFVINATRYNIIIHLVIDKQSAMDLLPGFYQIDEQFEAHWHIKSFAVIHIENCSYKKISDGHHI